MCVRVLTPFKFSGIVQARRGIGRPWSNYPMSRMKSSVIGFHLLGKSLKLLKCLTHRPVSTIRNSHVTRLSLSVTGFNEFIRLWRLVRFILLGTIWHDLAHILCGHCNFTEPGYNTEWSQMILCLGTMKEIKFIHYGMRGNFHYKSHFAISSSLLWEEIYCGSRASVHF